MLVGIISDIHDQIGRLRVALDRLQAAGAEALICCGDLCSPFIVAELARGFPEGSMAIVFGNNDGDRFRIMTVARQMTSEADVPRIEIAGESATLEFGGKRIFVHHFNDVGALVAATGQFDLVCYGHNHEWLARRHPGGTLEVNPGAVMGWHPRRGDIPSTYALYDTEAHEARISDAETGEIVASTASA
ncbi:MAG: YfcE family phosphodiesterase [Thermomicrobiales bacterium]|nr:YfcE family phosphodiesterase [Thermomicrobiales bacterium]